METMRDHYKVRLKLANRKRGNKFNHEFLGRTKKFHVATHLTSQTSYLATHPLQGELIGVDGTLGRL